MGISGGSIFWKFSKLNITIDAKSSLNTKFLPFILSVKLFALDAFWRRSGPWVRGDVMGGYILKILKIETPIEFLMPELCDPKDVLRWRHNRTF